MRLGEIAFEFDFFWKGVRYTQVIRPKYVEDLYTIVCRQARSLETPYLYFTSDTEIKPVLKYKPL